MASQIVRDGIICIMGLIARFIGAVFAVLLADRIIPGFDVEGLYAAVIVTVILGIANITIKPLLHLLALPLTIMTLGLFSFVISALVIWFVASFVEGFSIDGFLPALLGGALIACIQWILRKLS